MWSLVMCSHRSAWYHRSQGCQGARYGGRPARCMEKVEPGLSLDFFLFFSIFGINTGVMSMNLQPTRRETMADGNFLAYQKVDECALPGTRQAHNNNGFIGRPARKTLLVNLRISREKENALVFLGVGCDILEDRKVQHDFERTTDDEMTTPYNGNVW